MQEGHPAIEERFSGTYNSHGGSQFLGNSFNTSGAPIYIGSDSDNKLPTRVCELPRDLLSHYFTGRDDELQQIDRVLNTYSGDLSRRCVVYGMPGLGKTQLALQFATLAFRNSQHPFVFWVSAASVEKLTLDFCKMADLLRLRGWDTVNLASKLTITRAWLEEPSDRKSWLIVFDNVKEETARMLRDDILPRGNCGGRVLMTTRTAGIADLLTASGVSFQLALQPPGTSDAVAMLLAGAKLGREDKEEATHADAGRLVQSFRNLPLAIDQAASYMRETGDNPQEILNKYQSDKELGMLSWENDLTQHEEKSVVATFTPALIKIKDIPDAMTLLRILCFCDPEGISISIFKQGGDALEQEDPYGSSNLIAIDGSAAFGGRHHTQGGDQIEAVKALFRSHLRLSKAIQEVQRLSLATQALEDSHRIIRIHDLVQHILRSVLMEDTERRQWLQICISIVCEALMNTGDPTLPQNWSRCGRFISYIESLEGFALQYGFYNDALLVASELAALYLDGCGLYEKAAMLDKRSFERRKRIFGSQHPSTLVTMENLANVLEHQGKYEEAEKMHRETLALKESVLGKKHHFTLNSMMNLASVLESQKKYEEAESMRRETLILSESMLGRTHPDTLMRMSNLAIVLKSQGKYEEVEEMHRQTLDLTESVLSKEHPNALTSMSSLAAVFESQDKYEEAERMHRQTLILSELELGKKHLDTLQRMTSLAIGLGNQLKFAEAEEIFRQELVLREAVQGKDHPDTLRTVHNLAHLLRFRNHYDDADSLYQRALSGFENMIGGEHPILLHSLGQYASMLLEVREMRASRRFLEETQKWERNTGESDTELAEPSQ